jgi:excisionase family DNA binding protein
MQNPSPTLPRLLSAQEAAEYLGVHINTMRRLLAAGQIPGKRIGGSWYINAEQLAAAVSAA